jgi:hypothetical protein
MATEAGSVVATTPAPVTADTPGRGGRGGGRGRGRGGGRGRGRGDSFQQDGGYHDQRQSHRGRGGFRGAAHPNGSRPQTIPGNAAAAQTPSAAVNGKGVENQAGKTIAEGADESEAEVCFICASPVVHEAIYPCNHRTCHICSLRMRALYKDKNCVHCRVCG